MANTIKNTTEKGKYVRIQSSINIKVTAGLQHADYTQPDAHIPDRLKVGSLWPKLTCMITEGVGVYPSEILEWNTVKSLEKEKLITIGETFDDTEDEQVVNKKEELELNLKEAEARKNNGKETLPNI